MKLIKKKYKERQQPIERIKFGHLEKQKEALKRLKILKENEIKHNKLILQSKQKTGNEYFFKMNVCENIEGEIIPIYKKILTKNEKNKILFEKNRIEKKLKTILPSFQSKKINLETGEIIKVEHKQNNEREKYEKYLKEINNLLK